MSIEKTRAAAVIKPAEKRQEPVVQTPLSLPARRTASPAARVTLRQTELMLHNDGSQDIRQSRVDEIRAALADGSYSADNHAIARGIADSLMQVKNDAD